MLSSVDQAESENRTEHRNSPFQEFWRRISGFIDSAIDYRFHPAAKIVIAALVSLVIVYRAREQLLHPAFWAEDGREFYAPAYNSHSLLLLLAPYSGYLHIVPRLCAAFAVQFPLSAGPLVMSICAILVMIAPIFYLLSNREGILSSDISKVLTCLIYSLAPFPPECFNNPTNSQWFGFLLLTIIASSASKSKIMLAVDYIVCVLFSLSGPFCFFVAVSALLLHFAMKMKLNRIPMIIMSIAALIQIPLALTAYNPLHVGHISAQSVLWSYFDSFRQVIGAHRFWLWVSASLLGIRLFYSFRSRSYLPLMMLICSFFCVLSLIRAYQPLDGRYLFPVVLASVLLIVPDRMNFLRNRREVLGALALLIWIGFPHKITVYKARDYGNYYQTEIRKFEQNPNSRSIDIPVAPGAWGGMTLRK
jgi:hypothetical protein